MGQPCSYAQTVNYQHPQYYLPTYTNQKQFSKPYMVSSGSNTNTDGQQASQSNTPTQHKGEWEHIWWTEVDETKAASAQNFPTPHIGVMESEGFASQKEGTNICDEEEEHWKIHDITPPEDKLKRRKVDKCELGYNFQNFSHLPQSNTCNPPAGANIFAYEQISAPNTSLHAHIH